MSVNDSTLTKRYALKIALIYLLIRGIPELLLFVVNFLPAQALASLAEHHDVWLRFIYPVIPVHVPGVPFGFQLALALLPVLIIEVLLVFLFSAWFLRRKPWVASSINTRRWLPLILATLIGTLVIRHQLLAYVQTFATDALQARQSDADWFDKLPFLFMKVHWTLTAVFYVTTPLWAWMVTWLHFRFAKKSADATKNANINEVVGAPDVPGAPGMAIALHRATVFASFLLGCVALHFVFVQTVYLGLWPWATELLRVNIPLETHYASGVPLALSQIVFSTFMCVLAAHVYVRRLTVKNVVFARLQVLKPLLSGAAAYLLTCFLFLALLWLVIWLSPELIDSLLREFSYAPESGVVYVIALNLGALLLLWFVSDRLGESPRRWSGVLAALIVCASVPSYVGWTLAGSNMGITGGKPGIAVTGELGDARLRNMEQWCTGVVETRHGTWLVGRYDISRDSANYVPADVPDLGDRVIGPEGTDERQRSGMFGSRPVLTTLALLQEDGQFKVMATVPDVACMVVSPESETLFLFTGVRRPYSALQPQRGQTAVFRSTDHGATWEWLEAGFMADVQDLAWSVKSTFFSDRDVWSWGVEPPGEDDTSFIWGRRAPVPARHTADGTEVRPTALFYSADQGKTSTVIYSPEPLVVPLSYLRNMVGESTAKFSSNRSGDQKRFVVQVDDHRAYAWVSEHMWYHVGEESKRLMLMTRAELSRSEPAGEWTVTRVTREPGAVIRHLSTSMDGRTYAIMSDQDGEWLARLDTQSGAWVERQRTPSLLPGWLADDDTSTRYFWSNGDYQVASKWGYTHVPRLLIPFHRERAEINTDAHFYTRDGGRTWHQLAIPGYLGVMGLSAYGSKLYWSKGNWYSNNEPQQWEYDLAR